jgi:hemophore-related protein
MVTATPLPMKELVHVALGPYRAACGSWCSRLWRSRRCDVVWCSAHGVGAARAPAYLFTHPDVNFFFTSLEGQHRDDIRDDVQTYLDANPVVKAELTGIRQPLVDLKNRCGTAPAPDVP